MPQYLHSFLFLALINFFVIIRTQYTPGTAPILPANNVPGQSNVIIPQGRPGKIKPNRPRQSDGSDDDEYNPEEYEDVPVSEEYDDDYGTTSILDSMPPTGGVPGAAPLTVEDDSIVTEEVSYDDETEEPEDTDPEDTEAEDTDPEDYEPEDTDPEDTDPGDTDPDDYEPEDTESDPSSTEKDMTKEPSDPAEYVYEDDPEEENTGGSIVTSGDNSVPGSEPEVEYGDGGQGGDDNGEGTGSPDDYYYYDEEEEEDEDDITVAPDIIIKSESEIDKIFADFYIYGDDNRKLPNDYKNALNLFCKDAIQNELDSKNYFRTRYKDNLALKKAMVLMVQGYVEIGIQICRPIPTKLEPILEKQVQLINSQSAIFKPIRDDFNMVLAEASAITSQLTLAKLICFLKDFLVKMLTAFPVENGGKLALAEIFRKYFKIIIDFIESIGGRAEEKCLMSDLAHGGTQVRQNKLKTESIQLGLANALDNLMSKEPNIRYPIKNKVKGTRIKKKRRRRIFVT